MKALRLSVIVVSRHRKAALIRCLTALTQQGHFATEVIVVADPEGVAAVRALKGAFKTAAFDIPNISAARNLGLSMAAGEVVAFIDDDAVPEPTWGGRLVAPFADPKVVAATGFIRGRNGISYQWRAMEVDALGCDHPLEVPMAGVTLLAGTASRAVKTTGTNCAFRTAALRAIGGFDPAFRFYLDEADVNLRLAPVGVTAIVPSAQVHHGYLASGTRRADRVPLDLTEIAASSAVFLRRHAPEGLEQGKAALWQDQRARALRHMIAGGIEPRDVRRLMASLETGWAEGMGRVVAALPALPKPDTAFKRLRGLFPRPRIYLFGRRGELETLIAKAERQVVKGQITTILCLSWGWRRHRYSFDPRGFWLQTGGLWGRSDRDGPRPGRVTHRQRIDDEIERLAGFGH